MGCDCMCVIGRAKIRGGGDGVGISKGISVWDYFRVRTVTVGDGSGAASSAGDRDCTVVPGPFGRNDRVESSNWFVHDVGN